MTCAVGLHCHESTAHLHESDGPPPHRPQSVANLPLSPSSCRQILFGREGKLRYPVPGVEPQEALDVVDDSGAEVLGGDGGLDPVHDGALEAAPGVRGDGRGVRAR
ncbi:hypothetical protein BS78_04G094200 [Paspalum vaginatum]|nr:hypothetical protein BS78_04G094200 [Paspalum vaginatum]